MAGTSQKAPVSATVITFNEAGNIRDCLKSLEWVDDLVVVDSFSTDGTAEIAWEFTDRVCQCEWPGFVEQKNYALSLAKHDWVFSLDADERVTPELRDEILKILESPPPDCGAFEVPRTTFYLGRWIRHCGWSPDRVVRLFQKSKGRFVGRDLHERFETEGRMARLDHPILHYNYANISAQLATVNKYSGIVAQNYRKRGKAFCLGALLVRPPIKFLETYLWKLGILDGLPGLVIAVMDSYYMFLRYAKLWELERTHKEESTPASSE